MKCLTVCCFYLFMSYSFNLNAQITNNGFENWETDSAGNYNPVGWQTTNDFPLINVEPFSPGCQGQFAMTVKTINAGFAFPGFALLETAINFNERPTKFYACVKSNIMSGDQVLIMIALMKGDSAVAVMDSCTFKIDLTITQFTNLEFPITYQSNLIPDSLIIIVSSGFVNVQVGTELTIDEIGFINGSSDISSDENLLNEFELFQNFPNPFNPITSIRYQIPVSADVEIKVFDLLGKDVGTLVNEFKNAGKYEINFNANQFSSGVYFYKITAGNFSDTKKMIILK